MGYTHAQIQPTGLDSSIPVGLWRRAYSFCPSDLAECLSRKQYTEEKGGGKPGQSLVDP